MAWPGDPWVRLNAEVLSGLQLWLAPSLGTPDSELWFIREAREASPALLPGLKTMSAVPTAHRLPAPAAWALGELKTSHVRSFTEPGGRRPSNKHQQLDPVPSSASCLQRSTEIQLNKPPEDQHMESRDPVIHLVSQVPTHCRCPVSGSLNGLAVRELLTGLKTVGRIPRPLGTSLLSSEMKTLMTLS